MAICQRVSPSFRNHLSSAPTHAAEYDIAHDRVAAVAIVEIDGRRAVPRVVRVVVDVVPPHHVPATGPIAPRVKYSHVGIVNADVVDLVQFQDVFVSAV